MNRFRCTHSTRSALLVVIVLGASVFMGGGTSNAAAITPIGLGTATNFAVRAGDTVTNPGGAVTSITGDIGLNPGGSYGAGLMCSNMTAGSQIFTNAGGGPPCPAAGNPGLMTTAENDARTAFNHTVGLGPGTVLSNPDLNGQSLVSGLYSFSAAATNLAPGGTLTLNAQGDPNAVWILQASSTLITSPGSNVVFSNPPPGVTAAQLACNVFWTAGSSATIDTTTNFIGTILASVSITVNTGATVQGRLLAANQPSRGGAVTLAGTIVRPTCAVLPPGTGGPVAPPTLVVPPAPPTLVVPPTFTG